MSAKATRHGRLNDRKLEAERSEGGRRGWYSSRLSLPGLPLPKGGNLMTITAERRAAPVTTMVFVVSK
jgi:hypothetical protein